jgi:hypothetical protein
VVDCQRNIVRKDNVHGCLSLNILFRGFMIALPFFHMIESSAAEATGEHPLIELRGVNKSYQTAAGELSGAQGCRLELPDR